MITPLLVAFNGTMPDRRKEGDWVALNVAASTWFADHLGCAPVIGECECLSIAEPPASPATVYPPTYTQVRNALPDNKVYSALFQGLPATSGMGERGRLCTVGAYIAAQYPNGMYPRLALWMMIHEQAHVAGITHPPDFSDPFHRRTDTINAYDSCNPFSDGVDMTFLPGELATIRESPLWEKVVPVPLEFGPDVSNYQDWLTKAHADALVAKQCTFAVIGRQAVNRTAWQQRQAFIDAGIIPANIMEYLMNLNGTWPFLFPETRYVAIDVEENSEFITEWDIDNAINWIRQQGREPVIYTSKFYWDSLGLTNVTKYGEQGIKLWNAKYDGRTDGLDLGANSFGGWTRCVLDQYTDRWNDDGVLPFPVDMNDEDGLFDNPVFVPVPVPDPVDVPAQPIAGFVEVNQAELVEVLNDAATGSLGKVIGGGTVIKYLVKNNGDGTWDFRIANIPVTAAPDLDAIK